MEYKEWEAITQHRAALTSYVDVKEVVHYLKCEIEDPPAGTYFSPIDVQLESAEIDQFQDHIVSLCFFKFMSYVHIGSVHVLFSSRL